MGIASAFFEEALHEKLVARFPSVDLFEESPGASGKLSLSEKFGWKTTSSIPPSTTTVCSVMM